MVLPIKTRAKYTVFNDARHWLGEHHRTTELMLGGIFFTTIQPLSETIAELIGFDMGCSATFSWWLNAGVIKH